MTSTTMSMMSFWPSPLVYDSNDSRLPHAFVPFAKGGITDACIVRVRNVDAPTPCGIEATIAVCGGGSEEKER